jgi:hypothetical protein
MPGCQPDKHGLTIGFDACLRKCISEEPVKCLTEDEAVTLQNVNSLRDAAQHYFTELSEDLLYIYSQSAVTLFDKLATDVLSLTLKKTMPNRVLPVSPKPPRDFGLILDSEFGDMTSLANRPRPLLRSQGVVLSAIIRTSTPRCFARTSAATVLELVVRP